MDTPAQQDRATHVVIFANGEFTPPPGVEDHLHGRRIICADGGTRHALALGLTPHVIIGDLDSVPGEMVETLAGRGTEILRFPRDKDQTDLELALAYAIERGAEDILLLGLLGGRLDQTLANVFLLALPEWERARLWLADGPDTAYLLRSGDTLTLTGRRGDTVSLLPLTPTVTGVSTQGLRWPLQDATLHFGRTLTVSNELVGRAAEVRVGTGKMLVVIRDTSYKSDNSNAR